MHKTSIVPNYIRDWIIKDKTRIEAGYVNDPDDSGGETNHGITVAVARKNGYTGNMIDLTVKAAFDMYVVDYWNKMLLDDVNACLPILSDWLFDFGINAGVDTAVKALQLHLTVLNNKGTHYPDLEIDGLMGKATMFALRAYINRRGNAGIANLILALVGYQFTHYITLSHKVERDEKYTFGWLTRARLNIFEYVNMLA